MPLHPNMVGVDLHEDKRLKQPVRAASTATVTLATPGASLDGVTLSSGDRVLLKNQAAPAQNGIYIWTGAASLLTRALDALLATDFVYGFIVYSREGTANGATYWSYTQSAAVTLETTALTFVQIAGAAGITDPTSTRGDLITRGASALQRFALGIVGSILTSNGTDPVWTTTPTIAGEVTAADFKPSGLTGATAATRIVGGTVSGAPTTGTFAVGDFVIDQAAKVWVCTGAGSPGTWGQAGGGMGNPMTVNQDMITGAAAGTPARLAVGANGQVLTITSGVIGWANSASGFSNPMTTTGDVIYGGSGGSPQRLPNGANTQVLTMTAGLPGWANPPGGAGGVTNNVSSALFLARTCI